MVTLHRSSVPWLLPACLALTLGSCARPTFGEYHRGMEHASGVAFPLRAEEAAYRCDQGDAFGCFEAARRLDPDPQPGRFADAETRALRQTLYEAGCQGGVGASCLDELGPSADDAATRRACDAQSPDSGACIRLAAASAPAHLAVALEAWGYPIRPTGSERSEEATVSPLERACELSVDELASLACGLLGLVLSEDARHTDRAALLEGRPTRLKDALRKALMAGRAFGAMDRARRRHAAFIAASGREDAAADEAIRAERKRADRANKELAVDIAVGVLGAMAEARRTDAMDPRSGAATGELTDGRMKPADPDAGIRACPACARHSTTPTSVDMGSTYCAAIALVATNLPDIAPADRPRWRESMHANCAEVRRLVSNVPKFAP